MEPQLRDADARKDVPSADVIELVAHYVAEIDRAERAMTLSSLPQSLLGR